MDTVRVLAALILSALPLPAQDAAGVRGEVAGTRKRLVAAEDMLQAGQAAKAREALAAIIDTAGDDLIQTSEGHYRSARTFAQTLLAKLPEEQLKIYRARIDDAAAKLLAEGKEQRDPKPLLELIDRYAVSRLGEEALTLLGELAFERGEFALAEKHWTRIAAKTPLTNARILLAIYFQHDVAAVEKPSRVAAAFSEFEKLHPGATGRLAGRDGKLVEILRDLLSKPPVLQAGMSAPLDWATLGANASRTGSLPGSLAAMAPSPLWSVPIPGAKTDGSPRLGSVRRVAFHPVLDGQNAYLADAARIIGFDLSTGRSFTVLNALAIGQDAMTSPKAPLEESWRDADFSLTLHRGRIYGRLGTISIIPGDTALASHLVCVSRVAGTSQLHWARKPPVSAGVLAGWEGSPLVLDGHVLTAFSRVEGGRVIQAIACYGDAEKPLWTTDVCELGLGAAEGRERHELLTIAGTNVVFASHTGVIAAVNRHTGKNTWTIRYPRVASVRHRDISPAVASEGGVFVAPNDSDRLFALDADTGRQLWQSQPLAVDHILGVHRGRVVAAIAGPNRGLRAFDARTGDDAGIGWQRHDDPNLPTVGRGAIVGDLVAWPTQTGLYLIRLVDGAVARLLRDVNGNVGFANGKLLVASARSLSLFATPGVSRAEEPYPLMVIAPTKKERIENRKTIIAGNSPSLRPILAHPAKLDVITRLPPGRYFQAPQERHWGNGPALLDDSRIADNAIYCGDNVLVISPMSWRYGKLDGPPIWIIGHDVDPLMKWKLKVFGKRIVASPDRRHLLGMTLSEGKADWCWNARGGHEVSPYSIESAPRFDTCFLADEITVIRRTDGRAWIIDTASGERIDDLPCDSGSWQTPPVRLDEDRIAITTGPGRIAAYDVKKRKIAWSFEAGRDAGLSGNAPQLHADSAGLTVIISRNHGCECLRLDRSGHAIWPTPASLVGQGVHLLDGDFDSTRIYLPLSDRLIALRKDNGSCAWETPIAETARWRVIALESAVALIPRALTLDTPRVSFDWLKQPIPMLCAAIDGLRSPVLLLDSETGRLQQRIDSFDGPLISATVADSGLWFATARTIYRLK